MHAESCAWAACSTPASGYRAQSQIICIAFPCSRVPIVYRSIFGTISHIREARMMRGGLLWLLGIPLPIILLLWFFGVFH